jgi:hypothetical protein
MRGWGEGYRVVGLGDPVIFRRYYFDGEGLYRGDIAEFALILIALSLVPAVREFISLVFQSTMRLRRIIAWRPRGIFPFCRSIFVQLMKICHHFTFL